MGAGLGRGRRVREGFNGARRPRGGGVWGAGRRSLGVPPAPAAKSEGGAVKSRHLLAKEHANLTSTMAEQADAEAEALRLFTLWSSSPALYRIRAGVRAPTWG